LGCSTFLLERRILLAQHTLIKVQRFSSPHNGFFLPLQHSLCPWKLLSPSLRVRVSLPFTSAPTLRKHGGQKEKNAVQCVLSLAINTWDAVKTVKQSAARVSEAREKATLSCWRHPTLMLSRPYARRRRAFLPAAGAHFDFARRWLAFLPAAGAHFARRRRAFWERNHFVWRCFSSSECTKECPSPPAHAFKRATKIERHDSILIMNQLLRGILW